MDPVVMTKDGKANRLARTPAEAVELSYEGYVAKVDEDAPELPALSLPAHTVTEHDEDDDATLAPFTTE